MKTELNQQGAEAAVREMASEGASLQESLNAPVTDSTADWLAANYAAKARRDLDGADEAKGREILRAFVKDWHLLRRGDHSAQRLQLIRENTAARVQLARERLELQRAESVAAREKEFWEWTKKPNVQEKLYPNRENVISKETIRKIEKELRLL
jgi:hypothetical protein